MSRTLILIAFRRTGGFAGNLPAPALDAPVLAPEDAAAVARLVEAVDPPAQARPPGAAPGAGGGADRMRYELVVEMDGQRRRVVFGEGDVPSELRPLLARLTRLARGARG